MTTLSLATWNVNSLNVRLPHVLDWLVQTKCDILCLQELKLTDDKFPVQALAEVGYAAAFSGQKTYNGVAILTRTSSVGTPRDVETQIPGFADEQRRLISATCSDIRVICGYFPNGESLESEKFQYKMNWLQALSNHCQSQLKQHERLILTGDFNIAPTDADVHDPALWAGKLHCSEIERGAFNRLLDLGLVDAFRLFEQAPKQYSWWDYRMMGFRRNAGLRIDHVLVSAALKPAVTKSYIDKAPRKLEKPSDHTPVVVELSI
jgi:exodeoxyribonuclease III